MFAAWANTPVAMDFLVEVCWQRPDNAPKVFTQLLNEMRAQNSFEGFYGLSVDRDPDDGMSRTAQSNDERMKLETSLPLWVWSTRTACSTLN